MVKRVTKMGRISLPMDVRSTSDIPAFENMLTKGPMAVVLVYADWCGHCNTYKENVWSPLKSTKGRKLNMASVHYDQLENTSLKNSKIEGYPSLLVVGTDKKPATFNTDSGVTNAMPNANELSTMKKIITAPVNTNKNRNSLRNVNVEDTNVENMNSSLENMDTNDEDSSVENANTGNMNSMRNANTGNMNNGITMNTGNMNNGITMNTGNMNNGITMNTGNVNNGRMNTGSMNTSILNTGRMNANNSNISVSTEEIPGATIENITPPNISSDTVSTLSSGTSSPLQPIRSLNSASNSVDEENKPLRNNTQGTTPLLRGGGGLYRKLTGKKHKKSKKRTVKRKN
jgi:thiol-disulfide isomerase/thioredoxin